MKSVLKHVPQINQNEHNFFLTDRLLSLSLPSSLLFCDSLYVGSFTISVYIGGGSSLSVSTGIGQSPGSYGGGGASSAACVPVAGVVVIVALGVVSVLVSVSGLLTVSASSSVDNYMQEKNFPWQWHLKFFWNHTIALSAELTITIILHFQFSINTT